MRVGGSKKPEDTGQSEFATPSNWRRAIEGVFEGVKRSGICHKIRSGNVRQMSSNKTQLTFGKIHARFAERSVWWGGGKFDTTVFKKYVRAEDFLEGGLFNY